MPNEMAKEMATEVVFKACVLDQIQKGTCAYSNKDINPYLFLVNNISSTQILEKLHEFFKICYDLLSGRGNKLPRYLTKALLHFVIKNDKIALKAVDFALAILANPYDFSPLESGDLNMDHLLNQVQSVMLVDWLNHKFNIYTGDSTKIFWLDLILSMRSSKKNALFTFLQGKTSLFNGPVNRVLLDGIIPILADSDEATWTQCTVAMELVLNRMSVK